MAKNKQKAQNETPTDKPKEAEDTVSKEMTQEEFDSAKDEMPEAEANPVEALEQRIAELEAKLQEKESEHEELQGFRKAKEAQEQAARDAELLKPIRVTARHLALRPKTLVKPGGERIPLSILVVHAKNDAHAKGLYIQRTAERIKHSGIAFADKYMKEFLNSAEGADYTFDYLDEHKQVG